MATDVSSIFEHPQIGKSQILRNYYTQTCFWNVGYHLRIFELTFMGLEAAGSLYSQIFTICHAIGTTGRAVQYNGDFEIIRMW